MASRSLVTAVCLAALAASAGSAHAARGAEEWAQIGEGETASLDLQSIRKFGDSLGRFDVLIAWTDPARPAPEDYLPRTVRYVTNCDEGTMTLAAVGLYDRNGQVAKTLVVPPGVADAVKPPKDGEAAKWLRRACMF